MSILHISAIRCPRGSNICPPKDPVQPSISFLCPLIFLQVGTGIFSCRLLLAVEDAVQVALHRIGF